MLWREPPSSTFLVGKTLAWCRATNAQMSLSSLLSGCSTNRCCQVFRKPRIELGAMCVLGRCSNSIPSEYFTYNFLNLQPFTTVPCLVVTPSHKITLLPLPNCNFATAINCNVNIYFPLVLGEPCEKPRGVMTHRLKT